MEITEVSKDEYKQKVNMQIFFNKVEFNELNSYKTDKLLYLIGKNNKYRFGIIVGVKDKEAYCPFSAPYGMPVSIRKEMSIRYYDEFLLILLEFLSMKEITKITLTLPPMFYSETENSIWLNCLIRNGFSIELVDLNYQIFLEKGEYLDIIKKYSTKKNLLTAGQCDLNFVKCTREDEMIAAYNIISENRKYKGRSLKMTCNELIKTMELVNHEVFIVIKEKEILASAFVYQVTNQIAQVIYWGDKPKIAEKYRTMNFLAYKIFEYYKEKKFKYLDIGTSTENGVPNYGLCDFKSTIGCDVSSKFTLSRLI